MKKDKEVMPLVLRTNGDEPYHEVKVAKSLADKLEKEGFISGYNEKWGYIEGDYKNSRFEYKGIKFKIEYFSGCFNPFLLMLK
jgi:hypothetical protein